MKRFILATSQEEENKRPSSSFIQPNQRVYLCHRCYFVAVGFWRVFSNTTHTLIHSRANIKIQKGVRITPISIILAEVWHLFVSHKITNLGARIHSLSVFLSLSYTLLIFAQFNSLNRSIHFDRMCVVAMFKYPKIKVRVLPLVLQTTTAAAAVAIAEAINSHSVPIFGLSFYLFFFLFCRCVVNTHTMCVIWDTLCNQCFLSHIYQRFDALALSLSRCMRVGIFRVFFLFSIIVWYTKHTQNHTPQWVNFQCDNRNFPRSAAHTHTRTRFFLSSSNSVKSIQV